MSNLGQAVLTVVGTGVGAFFGNPALGFTLGSLAGNLLFPTKTGAPKIGDTTVTTASEGAPMALLYGMPRVAGTLIEAPPIRVDTSSHSAKGGPQVSTNTYYATGLYSFGTSPLGPMAGVAAIWVDNKLLYDVRDGVSAATLAQSASFWDAHCVFYPGSDTQLPDPTLEAHYGVGNVPAYRGQVLLLLHDYDCTANGARMPQVSVLLVYGTAGSSATSALASDVLYPWISAGKDPRNCKNDHEYFWSGPSGGSWQPSLATVLSQASTDVGATVLDTLNGWSKTSNNGGAYGADYTGYASPYFSLTAGEQQELILLFNTVTPTKYVAEAGDVLPLVYGGGSIPLLAIGVGLRACGLQPDDSQLVWWSGVFQDDPTQHLTHGGTAPTEGSGIFRIHGYASSVPIVPIDTAHGEQLGTQLASSPPYFYGFSDDSTSLTTAPGVGFYPDVLILVRRKPRSPDNPCAPRCQEPFPLFPGTSEYCVIGGEPVQSVGYSMVGALDTTNRYRWLSDYHVIATGYGTVDHYPLGPVLAIGDANDTSGFWTSAYGAAVTAGTMPSGLTYASGNNTDPTHYPITKTYAWERDTSATTLTPTPITVGDICGSLSTLAGLVAGTDYDYSALTQLVSSYPVARISTARDAMTPLLQYQFGDISDDGSKLVGIVRGGSPVLTLADDDLAAIESGQETPPKVAITRTQPAELPRMVRVHFVDTTNDWQAGQELAVREYGPERQPTDIELAIGMTPDEAAQVADVLLNEAFAGREQYAIAIPATDAHLALKPAHVIALPVEGKTRQARIVDINYAFPGLLTLTLARSDANVYTSHATANSTPNSAPQAVGVSGPSYLVVLDIPSLRTVDNDAGVYVAPYGEFSGWPGCAIYESKDGGASYVERASTTAGCAVGTIRAALPSGSETVFDYGTTLDVDMQSGTLDSVTESAVTNGVNLFAVGAPGRWTIIGAVDAVLQMDGSYQLSGFLQGLRGTAANRGTSVAGDQIVLLDSRLRRVPESYSEIGQTRLLRAVTYGTALADATDYSFTVTGLSYTPPLTSGSAPAGAIITGGGTTGDSGSTTGSIAPGTAGNLLIDDGTQFVSHPVSGDGTLDASGALTVTKTNGVALTSAATTPLDTDATLAANSDAKIATQKAVKGYVDGKVAGLSWKQAVRAATTTAGTLATDFANGSTIDGVTLATGDRILIKSQATGSENGIYVVAASGAPTRATDADAGAELVNASCYVSEGTTNADTQWTCTTNAPITIGSTSLVFATLTTATYDWAADIHGSTSKTTPVDNDELGLVDSAASYVKKKLTWANLKAGIWSALGALIAGGTTKTTPVDGDLLPLSDSAASSATKYLSWANLKATAKTYFDTLYLSLTGGTLTGPLNWSTPVTLASAATVNIGAAASNEITISGTTTITAFDSIAAGAPREVTFSGALTLTHNATSLILPGAANITTAAGDVAEFLSLGSGNWRCVKYVKANGQAVVGAGLTNWTEAVSTSTPNATVPVVSFTVNNAATSVTAAIVPKGVNGAFAAAVSDNTATGGNQRGAQAVDLQLTRSSASQIASGAKSVLIGGSGSTASNSGCGVFAGQSNTVSGTNAVALGGDSHTLSVTDAAAVGGSTNTVSGSGAAGVALGGTNNTVDGNSSVAMGNWVSTRGVQSAFFQAGQRLALLGDAQAGRYVLEASTSNATPKVLTVDGNAAGTSNQVTLPNKGGYLCRVTVVATSPTVADAKAWTADLLITRGTTAGSTALVSAVTPTVVAATAGASTWSVSVTADTTNGALAVTATGQASTTIFWHATITTDEVVH